MRELEMFCLWTLAGTLTGTIVMVSSNFMLGILILFITPIFAFIAYPPKN
jgi:hypothetical protein